MLGRLRRENIVESRLLDRKFAQYVACACPQSVLGGRICRTVPRLSFREKDSKRSMRVANGKVSNIRLYPIEMRDLRKIFMTNRIGLKRNRADAVHEKQYRILAVVGADIHK